VTDVAIAAADARLAEALADVARLRARLADELTEARARTGAFTTHSA